jgi:hypothetical protein
MIYIGVRMIFPIDFNDLTNYFWCRRLITWQETNTKEKYFEDISTFNKISLLQVCAFSRYLVQFIFIT